jgi:hypothetical protein
MFKLPIIAPSPISLLLSPVSRSLVPSPSSLHIVSSLPSSPQPFAINFIIADSLSLFMFDCIQKLKPDNALFIITDTF